MSHSFFETLPTPWSLNLTKSYKLTHPATVVVVFVFAYN